MPTNLLNREILKTDSLRIEEESKAKEAGRGRTYTEESTEKDRGAVIQLNAEQALKVSVERREDRAGQSKGEKVEAKPKVDKILSNVYIVDLSL